MMETTKHFSEGGTGVTNFNREDIETYERAIKEFGDSDIFILKHSMGNKFSDIFFSLHTNNVLILSDFWKTFKKVTVIRPTVLERCLKHLPSRELLYRKFSL